MTSSSEWRQEWLGSRESPSPGGIAQLEIQKEACGEEATRNALLKQWREEKWIEDYVERETTGARKRVEDAEAAVQQEQDNMMHAEITGLTSREPGKTFEEMLVTFWDSLSDLASSNDGADGEDDDHQETEQGKLSEEDETSRVMGTITKTVKQCMERFPQKQMKLDELTQPEWEDAADYVCKWDTKYGTSELRVSAIFQPQTNGDAPAHLPTTFGELMDSLDIVHAKSQSPQGTSRPGSSHISLGSVKPQSKSSIPSGEPAAEPDSSTLLKAKPVEPVSFYPCT